MREETQIWALSSAWVPVAELSHSVLLDHPSASTHNRGARSLFPAFPGWLSSFDARVSGGERASTTSIPHQICLSPCLQLCLCRRSWEWRPAQLLQGYLGFPFSRGPWAHTQRIPGLWRGEGQPWGSVAHREVGNGVCHGEIRVLPGSFSRREMWHNSRSVPHHLSFHCSLTTKCFLCKQLEHCLLPPIQTCSLVLLLVPGSTSSVPSSLRAKMLQALQLRETPLNAHSPAIFWTQIIFFWLEVFACIYSVK